MQNAGIFFHESVNRPRILHTPPPPPLSRHYRICQKNKKTIGIIFEGMGRVL